MMRAIIAKAFRLHLPVVSAFSTTSVVSLPSQPILSINPTKQDSNNKEIKKPSWMEAIIHDKRTYFDDLSKMERYLMTDVKHDPTNHCFLFSFDNAPNLDYRRIETSYLALRESCRCSRCFSSVAQQRVHSLISLNTDEHPSKFQFDREKQVLHVTWASDGHQSAYGGPWLLATFTPHPLYEQPKKQLWKAEEYLSDLQRFDFEQICSQPDVVLKLLKSVATHGLVKIINAPKAPGALLELSKHLVYSKKTHYGEIFHVENKPTARNLAYAYGTLTQHIDLCYMDYLPGVQFLHCIRQAKKGGDSTFTDAFAVAEHLRHNHKDVFDVLSQTPIHFYSYPRDVANGFLVQKLSPINLSPDGSLKRVAFSNANFDSLRNLTVKKQIAFLKAMKLFMKTMESPEYRLMFKLKEGEISVFDNLRVTHGREAFDPHEARLFEGCYMDWDEIHSRIRLIQLQNFQTSLNSIRC